MKYPGNRPGFWHSLTTATAVPSPAPTSNLTNPQDERFRDHVSDEAEDSQLQPLAPLSESQLRPDGVWKPMRPGSNVSSETGKRSFEYSPIGFPPTVAKSTNSTHRGRSRQRARLSGTTSQAPRYCCHSPENGNRHSWDSVSGRSGTGLPPPTSSIQNSIESTQEPDAHAPATDQVAALLRRPPLPAA